MPDIGYGITVGVSNVAPATDPTVNMITNIIDVTPPNPSRDMVEVTSNSSANMTREYVSGMVDFGEASFEMNWDPGSTADLLINTLQTERTARTWRFTWTQTTPDRRIDFVGFVTGYERTSPLDDRMTATVTIKVTGAPVYAAGA
jgi:hypothetical protein